MQINFQKLRSLLKLSNMPVFRDEATTTAIYPYIVYEFVNETHKRSSSKLFKSMPMYQIAVVTDGTEVEYEPLKNVLAENGVEFSPFEGFPYDENDSTITQFITMVRCVN